MHEVNAKAERGVVTRSCNHHVESRDEEDGGDADDLAAISHEEISVSHFLPGKGDM